MSKRPQRSFQTSLDKHTQPTTSPGKQRNASDSDTNSAAEGNAAGKVQRMMKKSASKGNRVGNHEVDNEADDFTDSRSKRSLDDDDLGVRDAPHSTGNQEITDEGKKTERAVASARSDVRQATEVNIRRCQQILHTGKAKDLDIKIFETANEYAEARAKQHNGEKVVICWMQRDERIEDNWCLLYAVQLAKQYGAAVHIVFNMVRTFLAATYRHFHFLLKNLEQLSKDARSKHNLPFHLLMGNSKETIPKFVADHNALAVVCDFNPIKMPLIWKREVAEALHEQTGGKIPLVCVDAHNVVPCWVASQKLEIGARTLRSKLHRNLPEFLEEFPPIERQPDEINGVKVATPDAIDWEYIHNDYIQVDRSVHVCEWIDPTAEGGRRVLKDFVEKRVKQYAEKRNDPSFDSVSNLSPYFHFGVIAPQRAILEASRPDVKKANPTGSAAFIEEGLVRRELSDNWCFYNPDGYDKLSGSYDWAKQSLRKHEADPRPDLFTLGQLEFAVTYDPLWNAAQLQAIKHGKIHGYMRMYWAKKILEWTKTADEAIEYSIYLNDRYSIDGRDPNGYVGCMWSIAAVHDRGWTERPVFGKVRYMNYNGCKRKFDVDKFISQYPDAVPGTKGFKENQKRAEEFDKRYQAAKRPNLESAYPFETHSQLPLHQPDESRHEAPLGYQPSAATGTDKDGGANRVASKKSKKRATKNNVTSEEHEKQSGHQADNTIDE